jgi:hypothetical protein
VTVCAAKVNDTKNRPRKAARWTVS